MDNLTRETLSQHTWRIDNLTKIVKQHQEALEVLAKETKVISENLIAIKEVIDLAMKGEGNENT